MHRVHTSPIAAHPPLPLFAVTMVGFAVLLLPQLPSWSLAELTTPMAKRKISSPLSPGRLQERRKALDLLCCDLGKVLLSPMASWSASSSPLWALPRSC